MLILSFRKILNMDKTFKVILLVKSIVKKPQAVNN